MSIRNPVVERKARELARLRGSGMTEAIEEALDLRLEELGAIEARLRTQLTAISVHCAALPDLDLRSADEILGYDGNGGFGYGR